MKQHIGCMVAQSLQRHSSKTRTRFQFRVAKMGGATAISHNEPSPKNGQPASLEGFGWPRKRAC